MVGLRFVIGDCVLDAERFVFERSGEPVQVQPQVFDVLAYLLEHRDRVVPKEELLDSIWGDRFVSESALLSDHDPGEITFESFVADLETLVDSLGLERFPIVGPSAGGPVAVEYARRHPDRVSHLILIGAYVRGRLARASTPELLADAELQRELMKLGWGLDDHSHRLYFTSTFIPDADPSLWTDFAELLRRTTSADNAVRIQDATARIELTEAACEVTVPTLILHARGDLRIPFDQGLELASLIPDSRLVPLDSRNHLLRSDEPAWAQMLSEIDGFLGDG